MERRSVSVSLLAGVLVAALLPLASVAAEPPPLPASIAAVGDSITQAASSGGGLGTNYPANSWSTGTSTTVNSHYRRLLAINPAISGRAWNDSVSGAKMAGLNGQMQVVDRPAAGLPDSAHRRQRPVHGHRRRDALGCRLRRPVHDGDEHADRRLTRRRRSSWSASRA